MKKKLIFSLVCLMILFIITGCVIDQWHKENIEETYRDYWNYSLGDYEVSYEIVDDDGFGTGGFTRNIWYDYTFVFKDVNGNSRNITIDNAFIQDFNIEISIAAEEFLEENIEKLFESQNIQKVDGIDFQYDTSLFCEVERINKDVNLYDPNKGLKFKELSLNTLNQNNIKLIIGIKVALDGGIDDYPNLKQKLIENVKFIFENYEYSNITFDFTIIQSDDHNRSRYYLSYNGYNYNWTEKYY